MLSENEYRLAISEANILKEQSHPNIVKFFGLIDDILFNGSRSMMILLEYCPVNQNFLIFDKENKRITKIFKKRGDLNRNLEVLREIDSPPDIETQKRWTRQLIAAVKFLDSENIIHRDIKPSNILVVEQEFPDGILQFNLKLSDFGLAREFRK